MQVVAFIVVVVVCYCRMEGLQGTDMAVASASQLQRGVIEGSNELTNAVFPLLGFGIHTAAKVTLFVFLKSKQRLCSQDFFLDKSKRGSPTLISFTCVT